MIWILLIYINNRKMVLEEIFMKNKFIILLIALILLFGWAREDSVKESKPSTNLVSKEPSKNDPTKPSETINSENTLDGKSETDENLSDTESSNDIDISEDSNSHSNDNKNPSNNSQSPFPGYKLIQVQGGDTRGSRQPNVVVDVGFGEREYWAFTNEYGQLVRIIADVIIPQNQYTETLNSDGRYYDEEAFVPGVEQPNLDQGHVIADSLGGVANAYNITPQDSTLNRYGDQAYMETVMRQAGGSTQFEAIITYPNNTTQIPSHYKFSYIIKGNRVTHSFANENPEKVASNDSSSSNAKPETTTPSTPPITQPVTPPQSSEPSEAEKVKAMDTNKNNHISIKEAKNAGYKMPISKDHWLYKYMTDGDGDGYVGE